MSPMTKSLLVKKLKEVKEQIGDSESGEDDLSDRAPGGSVVDGVVAGSIAPTEAITSPKKLSKTYRDSRTGLLVQRALDNTRHMKTKLIIS